MLRTVLRTLSLPVLGAIATALILFVPTALAGSGVGSVFNLGQVNPVDATSTLKGTSAGAQLQVMNASTAAGAFSLYGVLTQATPGADSAAVRGINAGRAPPAPACGERTWARAGACTAPPPPEPGSASTGATPAPSAPAPASEVRPQRRQARGCSASTPAAAPACNQSSTRALPAQGQLGHQGSEPER